MGQIGKLRTLKYYEKDAIMFYCSGCKGPHMITINSPNSWTFDGNYDSPTISPSVLARGRDRDPNDETKLVDTVCHLFLKNGILQFLDDCTHELKGQSVPLPELPDWLKDD